MSLFNNEKRREEREKGLGLGGQYEGKKNEAKRNLNFDWLKYIQFNFIHVTLFFYTVQIF
jgi:hypothetical protein